MRPALNLFRIAALGAVLMLPANATIAAVAQGDFVGKSSAEISDQLRSQGYAVRKVETEDDLFEAFAELDGKAYEIYVDAETGKILKVKLDD